MMSESNPELRHRLLWLFIGYVLVAVIVYLSLTSSPIKIGPEFPFKDKFYHVLAYFSLMGWFTQIYHVQKQRVIFAISFIFMGVLLEYIQGLGSARYFETEDMIANALGVAMAVLLAKKTTLRFMLIKFERFF